jgi:hypothetical protein
VVIPYVTWMQCDAEFLCGLCELCVQSFVAGVPLYNR